MVGGEQLIVGTLLQEDYVVGSVLYPLTLEVTGIAGPAILVIILLAE